MPRHPPLSVHRPDRRSPERESDGWPALIVDSVSDPILSVDLLYRVRTWNRAAQRLFGYRKEEVLGRPITLLAPPGLRGELLATIQRAARVGQAELVTRRRRKNGVLIDVCVSVSPLRDAGGRRIGSCAIVRDMTERKRGEARLLSLRARVMAGQEAERRRLSLELHDGVGQILSGAKFGLHTLAHESAAAGLPPERILKVADLLDRAISEVRRVSRNLMPPELEHMGLPAALRVHCREFSQRWGIPLSLDCKAAPKRLSPQMALALYRIAQESLANIANHSRATRAFLVLDRKGPLVRLTASDDGRGCSLEHRRRRRSVGGTGLAHIRERAESFGGSMDFLSSPGQGAVLAVRMPLSRAS